jgi:hypothetical protein
MLRRSWIIDWHTPVDRIDHFTPYVLRPWGALLLLSVLRWRRPEARVLLAAALIPETAALYQPLVLRLSSPWADQVFAKHWFLRSLGSSFN